MNKVVDNPPVPALKEQLRDELARAERELWVSSSAAESVPTKDAGLSPVASKAQQNAHGV